MNYRLGTNQYKERPKYKFFPSVVLLLVLCTIVAFLGHLAVSRSTIISPLPVHASEPTPTPFVILVAYEHEIGDPIIDEVSRVFRKEGTKTVARAIMCAYSESKLNPNAYNFNSNGTADMGIFQINDVWGMSIEDRRNYKKNIAKAYEIYKKHGFKAWYAEGCK